MGQTRQAVGLVFGTILLAVSAVAELPPITVAEIVERMAASGKAIVDLRMEVEMTIHSPPSGPTTAPPVAGSPVLEEHRQSISYRMCDRYRTSVTESYYCGLMTFVDPPEWARSGSPESVCATDGWTWTVCRGSTAYLRHRRPTMPRLDGADPVRHFFGDEGALVPRGDLPHWHSDFLPPAEHEGQECYRLRLSIPPRSPSGKPFPAYIVWVCPAFGYAMVRTQYLNHGKMPEVAPLHADFVFRGIQEAAPGIWLPTRYERLWDDSGHVETIRYLGVNESLPRSQYRYEIPKGTMIVDRRWDRGLLPAPRLLLGFGLPILAIMAAILWTHYRRKPGT